MTIRRSVRRPDSFLCRLVSARHNGRLQSRIQQATRSASTIKVTHPTYKIPSKYPDPALFTPETLPTVNLVPSVPAGIKQSTTVPTHIIDPSVPVTLYSFPSFQPQELLYYPSTHLHLPLRRDFLHRAITFEGDACHPSTVWTPHRKDHPGSGRKILPQKGQGLARRGDSSSPILKGGIKPFGPKPRDMSTGLPRKIYDRAWRTALSWRYKKGELVVVDALCQKDMLRLDKLHIAKYVETFNGHGIGSAETLWTDEKDESKKPVRTTWIMRKPAEHDPGRAKYNHYRFMRAMTTWWPKDKVRDTETLDVKNLLEGQRIVIEKAALDEILRKRQSDLPKRINWAKKIKGFESQAESMQKAAEETKQMQAEMEKSALETIKALRSRKPKEIEAALSKTTASAANATDAQDAMDTLTQAVEKS